MKKFLLKRFLVSFITLWIIATASFVLLHMLPGNPFSSLSAMDTKMQERMIHYYGLDKPLFEQYLDYMHNLLIGNLGFSLKYTGQRVNDIISETFPYSAQLGIQSYLIGFPLGIFLGIISATNRGKYLDHLIMIFSALGMSIPIFILGTLLQYVFAIKLEIFPVAQWGNGMHTFLPTLTLAIGIIALKAQQMRTLMLEIMNEDYIQTAYSKGIPKYKVVINHQIKNAILPIVSNMGVEFTSVLMGSFVVEQIFAIPGLGAYYITSIRNLDYTMTLGITIFFSVLIILSNLIVDIVYGLIDPRLKIH